MKNKKLMIWISVSIIIAVFCVAGYYFNFSKKTVATVKVENLGNITINLFNNDNFVEQVMNEMLYIPLITYNDNKIGNSLISKLTINKNSTEYYIVLNQKNKWSSGRSIDSDDVIETFNNKRNLKLSSFKNITEISKISDTEIKINIKEPSKDFLYDLSIQYIYPKELKNGIVNALNFKDIIATNNNSIINFDKSSISINNKDSAAEVILTDHDNSDYQILKSKEYFSKYKEIDSMKLKALYIHNMYDLAYNTKKGFFKDSKNRERFFAYLNPSEFISDNYRTNLIANITNSLYFVDFDGYEYFDNKESNADVFNDGSIELNILANKDDEFSIKFIDYLNEKFKGKFILNTNFVSKEMFNIEMAQPFMDKYDLVILDINNNKRIFDFINLNYREQVQNLSNINRVLQYEYLKQERTGLSKFIIENNYVRPIAYEQKILKLSDKVYNNSKYEYIYDVINKCIDTF